MNDTLTITGQQAAVLYAALDKAKAVVENMLKLKAADQFRGALSLELASYRAEQDRIAQAFPTLTNAAA